MPSATLKRLLPLLFLFLFSARATAADLVVVQAAPLKVFEQFQHAFLAELEAENQPSGPKLSN